MIIPKWTASACDEAGFDAYIAVRDKGLLYDNRYEERRVIKHSTSSPSQRQDMEEVTQNSVLVSGTIKRLSNMD